MGADSERPDQAESKALSGDQRQALIRSLSAWAQRHPEPDRPVWGLAHYDQSTGDEIRDMLSPRELVEAVERDSPAGERFVHGVGLVLMEISFDDYLRSIDHSATRSRLIEPFLSLWTRASRRIGRSPSRV
ncbi:MAG TPA: hypothetical protein VFU30_14940 [Gaiellaceae bacterium]|nr:hypothetical protein [Gaiellaceae bacterium]